MLALRILVNILVLGLGVEIKGIQHYIINGTYVKPGEYPSYVSLHYKTVRKCGGSLISLKQVLTAAHCLTKVQYSSDVQISILAGGTHLQVIEDSRQMRYSRYFVIHPFHRSPSSAFDLAIVFVDSPFMETPYVKPIQVASMRPPLGAKCQVVGYGYTEHGNPNSSSQFLRKTTVDILDPKHCLVHGIERIFTICAGDLQGKRDASTGDSGGPLIYENKLVGVVCSGTNNASSAVYYGTYADVTKHLIWTESYRSGCASYSSNFVSSLAAKILLFLYYMILFY